MRIEHQWCVLDVTYVYLILLISTYYKVNVYELVQCVEPETAQARHSCSDLYVMVIMKYMLLMRLKSVYHKVTCYVLKQSAEPGTAQVKHYWSVFGVLFNEKYVCFVLLKLTYCNDIVYSILGQSAEPESAQARHYISDFCCLKEKSSILKPKYCNTKLLIIRYYMCEIEKSDCVAEPEIAQAMYHCSDLDTLLYNFSNYNNNIGITLDMVSQLGLSKVDQTTVININCKPENLNFVVLCFKCLNETSYG